MHERSRLTISGGKSVDRVFVGLELPVPVLRTWKSHSHFFRQSMLNGMVLYDDFRLGSNRYSGVGRERAGGDVWTGASVNVVLGKYQGRTGRRAFSKSLNHSTLCTAREIFRLQTKPEVQQQTT